MENLKNVGKAIVLGSAVYGLYRLIFANIYSRAEIDDPGISEDEMVARKQHNQAHSAVTVFRELFKIQKANIAIDPEAEIRARGTAASLKSYEAELERQHKAGRK